MHYKDRVDKVLVRYHYMVPTSTMLVDLDTI